MGVQSSAPLDVEVLRESFPILGRELDAGTDLIYLDNAATSLTPEPVLSAMNAYYRTYNANVHRGLHQLSQEASLAYEEAHDVVAAFIGATGGREEIVFTKNTTESLNLVAQAWGLNELGPGDEIVITEAEHHSNLVTWQQVATRTGATLRFIGFDADGYLDMADAEATIGPDTAVVGAVHISNALGTIVPVTELGRLAHDHGALFVVDGAQAVPTMPVDVEAIDADFYAFSGHKMLGPTGIGCLYGKRHLLDDLEPFLYGGEMIRTVSFESSQWNDLPWKFEAGTPPIAEGIGLAAAIEFLSEIGMERINQHEEWLTAYAIDLLGNVPGIELYGPTNPADRGGLLAFTLDGIHAHDIAEITNDFGVAIRAGHHCTQPLHERLGISATSRASFYLYNTRAEIDVLYSSIERAQELFA